MSIILIQLFFLAVFKLWPTQEAPQKVYQDLFHGEEFVIEDIIPTRQSEVPAAPPKPIVPIPVPNDKEIEEQVDFPEIEDFMTDSPILSDGIIGRDDSDSNEISGNPQIPPSVVKIVEPSLPQEAKSANLKAEILVSFLINQRGEVEEAFIDEIRVYEGKGSKYQVVPEIGYGLMEATIVAALKWRFRPAKDQGETVRAYSRQSFNIGY